jgi:ubiquinone/menaquinone biosynthesis C-methylase UbiE
MLNENQYASSDRYQARLYLNTRFKTNPNSKFRWIFDCFPKREGLNVLELGCGTGLFWLANRNAIPESWSITLSDYSGGMLEKTRDTLKAVNREFRYEVVDAGDIKYGDRVFDIVLANNMLYHIENRPKAIMSIHRILKDDGVFVASTMGKNDMMELNRHLYDFLRTRNKDFKFSELPFSLDNGLEQLKTCFANVDIFRYEDTLKIDEVDPVVSYYLSFNGMYNDYVILEEKDAEAFKSYLRNVMDSEKVISVTKESGVFVCTG